MRVLPKALLFDVFGTCVDWRTSLAHTAAALADELQLPARDWYAFVDAWRGHYQPQLETVRSGLRPWTKLSQLNREALDTVLQEFGLTEVADEHRDRLNRGWTQLTPWPDTVEGLYLLKQQAIIAPCSNADIASSVQLARYARLPWDVVLGAEISHTFKPQPETYLRSVEALGLHPGEVLMVAAHNADLQAARACGLQTAFVGRPHEHGPRQTTDLTPEHPYDYVARDFLHLAELLHQTTPAKAAPCR